MAVCGGSIGDPEPGPFPAEELAIANAVATRRSEFRAGRRYAREALAALGCPARALPRAPGGEPIWPEGFTGAIAHSDGFAIAIAAATSDALAVGVDVESAEGLDPELRPFIGKADHLGTAQERALGLVDAGKALFVAKEAAMKLYAALGEPTPDIRDVVVELETASQGHLRFHSPIDAPSASWRGAGALVWTEAWIAAAVVVPAAGAPHDGISPPGRRG